MPSGGMPWTDDGRVASATTTNATPTNVSACAVTVQRGEIARVVLSGMAYTAAGVSKVFPEAYGLVRRGSAANAVTEVMITAIATSDVMHEDAAAWSLAMDVSGNDVVPVITGETGVTVAWHVEMKVRRVAM